MKQSNKEYLNNHRDDSVKDLAKATGLAAKSIKSFLAKNPPAVAQAPLPEVIAEVAAEVVLKEGDNAKVKLGNYIVDNGSVIMTPGQSSKDDLSPQQSSGKPKFDNDLVPVHLSNKKLVPTEQQT